MWAIGSAFSVVLLARLASVSAQTSEAVCLPTYGNLTNSKGQDACLVSSYVQGSCNRGQWDVPVLGEGSHYVGPYKNEINACQCSSVVYDLVSACGLCQERTIVAWSSWSLNCTTELKAAGAFNAAIPPGTSIPAWAYWNPETHGDLFSISALDDLQGPESTNVPSATTSRPTTTRAQSSPSVTSNSTPTHTLVPTSNDTGGGGGPNIGAIVGGVVGGLLGIGLLGVLGIYLIRRSTSTAPSSQYTNGNSMSQPPHHPGLLSAPQSPPHGAVNQTWSPPPPSAYSSGGNYPASYVPPSNNYNAAPPVGYNAMGYVGGPATGSTYSGSRAGSTQPFDPNGFSPYQPPGSPPAAGQFHGSPTPRPGVYQGAAEL